MGGWLGLDTIRDILGVGYDTLKKRIQRGKFTQTRQVQVTGKGARGGLVWQIHITDPAIPEAARKGWLLAHAQPPAEAAAALPAARPETAVVAAAEKKLPAVTDLKDWQRETMDARLFFLRLVEKAEVTGIGVTRAIRTIVQQAQDGTLPEEAARFIPLANKRSGTDTKKRTLSERSLMRWWSDWNKAGKQIAALAPKAVEKRNVPAWGDAFLAAYRKPVKPSVAGALEDLAKVLPPAQCPSYHQATRFLKQVGSIEREKGRRTGQELRAIMPYIVRDTSDMEPGEVYISDGLTFKAWGVAHPGHGRPFSPEIVDVKDVYTRKIVGWSVGLAESGPVMAAALRNSIETHGRPYVWYHDKGPGYENELLTDDVTGILTRCLIHNLTSVAKMSQARGMIEKLRQDLWHKAAKEFLTYKGREMDREVKQRVYKIIKKDMREKGTSEFVMPWTDFLIWVQEKIDDYNNRPHSALPKVRDAVTGRRRHMTPNEMWDKAVADGWKPDIIPEAELADLFLPEKLCTVVRGQVTLFGNTYFHPALAEYHGDRVRVGYDFQDPRAVRVRDAEGRLVCFAGFEANKRRFVPRSLKDMVAEKREADRLRRLEVKADEIRLECLGTVETNAAPAVIELPPEVIAYEEKEAQRERQKVVSLDESRRLRDIGTPTDVYYLILDRIKAGTATPYQMQWKKDFEYWDETRKKVGLLLSDPYCFDDPDEQPERERQ